MTLPLPVCGRNGSEKVWPLQDPTARLAGLVLDSRFVFSLQRDKDWGGEREGKGDVKERRKGEDCIHLEKPEQERRNICSYWQTAGSFWAAPALTGQVASEANEKEKLRLSLCVSLRPTPLSTFLVPPLTDVPCLSPRTILLPGECCSVCSMCCSLSFFNSYLGEAFLRGSPGLHQLSFCLEQITCQCLFPPVTLQVTPAVPALPICFLQQIEDSRKQD